MIWPESSTPFYFEEDLLRGASIRRLAREGQAPLLIGSDQVEPVRPSRAARSRSRATTTPRSWCSPTAAIGAVYRKMHLVPFGEYVPLQRLLFFVGPLVEAVVGLHAGRPRPCCCRSAIASVSTAICYEVVFPSLMRAVRASTAASC